ncbi:hypothetical protein JS562_03230 [Agrobacterium sp. S2]|nr:hypothetical protein [Agrobacterium sp. S2]
MNSMGTMQGMDMEPSSDGDASTDIAATLKTMFETAEKPLTVQPIVVQNN